MRNRLAKVVNHVRNLEIEDINHHIIAAGYLVTGAVFNGHSTTLMTAVYLWAGLMHTNNVKALHLPALHLPKRADRRQRRSADQLVTA